MNDSYIIRHEQCPKCHSIGRDNGRDNLGIYSDHHAWCYSCGYYVAGNRITKFQSQNAAETLERMPTTTITLPTDSSTSIPTEAMAWLQSYELTQHTATKHHIMWSEGRQMLLFPYFIEGELLGWQGRAFGADKAKRKWFTQGRVDDFLYILGTKRHVLVLVESIISAIKLSRVCTVSPIFGSTVSMQRLLRISKFYDKIIIWLDPDKRDTAIKVAKKATLYGLDTQVIISQRKPKDYSLEEIQEYLLRE